MLRGQQTAKYTGRVRFDTLNLFRTVSKLFESAVQNKRLNTERFYHDKSEYMEVFFPVFNSGFHVCIWATYKYDVTHPAKGIFTSLMCVQVGWIQRIQCHGVNAVNPFMNLLEVFSVQIERLEWIQSVKSNAPTVAVCECSSSMQNDSHSAMR